MVQTSFVEDFHFYAVCPLNLHITIKLQIIGDVKINVHKRIIAKKDRYHVTQQDE